MNFFKRILSTIYDFFSSEKKNYVNDSTLTAERDINIGDHNHYEIRNIIQGDQNNYNLSTTNIPPIPHFLTIPPSISVFEGRKTEIKAVRKLIEDKKFVLVSGIGGIGKTALTQKLFNEDSGLYHHLAYIEIKTDLHSAFVNSNELITNLQLMEACNNIPENTPNRSQEILNLIINRFLQLEGKKFLLIDNMPYNDLTKIQALTISNWDILVTSRERMNDVETYELWELEEGDAIKVFVTYLGGYAPNLEDEEVIKQIVRRLGCHSLAIELVAKNSRKLHWTLTEINQKLQTKGLHIAEQANIKTAHAGNLLINNIFTHLLTVFPIEGLTETEYNLLIQFSFTPDLWIKTPTWINLFSEIPKDKLAFALTELHEKGWLSYDNSQDSYRMHLVIAEIIREKVKESFIEVVNPLVKNLKVKLEYVDGGYNLKNGSFADAKPFVEIVESITENTKQEELQILIGDLIIGACDYYFNIGNLNKALYLIQKAEDNLIIRNNIEMKLTCLDRKGRIYTLMNNIEYAEKCFQEILILSEKLYTENPTIHTAFNLSSIYSVVGEFHDKQGKIDDALIYYTKFNQILEAIDKETPNKSEIQLESHTEQLVGSYNAIGNIYLQKEEIEKALENFAQGFELIKNYGKSKPLSKSLQYRLGWIYERIGYIYLTQTKFEEALPYFEAYYELCNNLLSLDPTVKNSYNSFAISNLKLGETYRGLGDISQAKTYFQDAEKIWINLVADMPEVMSYRTSLNWVQEELVKL